MQRRARCWALQGGNLPAGQHKGLWVSGALGPTAWRLPSPGSGRRVPETADTATLPGIGGGNVSLRVVVVGSPDVGVPC